MTLSYILFTFSGAFSALVAVSSLVLKKTHENLKFVTYAVIFSFLEDLLAKYLTIKFHNSSWLFCFSTPAEYILFSMFLYKNSINTSIKKIMVVSFFCVYLYSIINLIIVHNPFPANLYTFIVTSFLVSLFAVSYYRDLLVVNIDSFKLEIPVLIIVTGLLVYNAFSAIYFSLLIYLGDTPAKYLNHVVITKIKEIRKLIDFTSVIMYLCIAAGLLISMFKKKETAIS